MRARTGAPSSSAFCADISTTAAPASFMPDALPAVTVPSGLNTGFSLPRPSTDASGRTCSSRVNSLVPFLDFSSTGTISSSNRPSSCARAARMCDSTENSSCCSRLMSCDSARFSAVTPMWILSNGSVSPPTTGSTTPVSPMRAPQRASGIQYGPRLMDSAPPATATSASPTAIVWAADTIACTPVPHSRFTVNAGTSFGIPAFIATTRAMYMSSGAEWITLPNTTWSTCAGSIAARSSAVCTAVAPRSVGGTPFKLPP